MFVVTLLTSVQFLLGTSIVLFATWLYSTHDTPYTSAPQINIDELKRPLESPKFNEKDMSIPIPKTPLLDEGALATSRPGSPASNKKRKNEVGYFTKVRS